MTPEEREVIDAADNLWDQWPRTRWAKAWDRFGDAVVAYRESRTPDLGEGVCGCPECAPTLELGEVV